ncbi:hypothetical protein PAECIP111891_04338 [Paenibacillus allorhizoplanae]|uniref:Copper amine oxidase N-terminal domain-containing protein n=1 Tax=Paenibacillus allorhizoplanae TaxID=2905648 RepID=A0ABM9CJI0_9BACL|nr:hypothetical protein [Paenibacillus allorhizoplanae]CAH1215921.1 hypothetical protein PAECIP111891_04338 [Paenibacillus allorhizoplanae]
MSKKKKLLLISACGLVILAFSSTSQAEAPSPGTTDPLITQSYFEQNTLSEAKVKDIVASAIAANAVGSNGGTSTPPTAAANMKVVQLENGQTMYAGAGAEFIVRSGKVLAVSNDENGIPDVTGGKDLPAGTEVALNHLLIFPTEGRGIKPSPKNDTSIYVMVRGGFLILNADGSKVPQ